MRFLKSVDLFFMYGKGHKHCQMEYKFGTRVKQVVSKSNIDPVEKERIVQCGRITFTELQLVCKDEVKNEHLLLECLADTVPIFSVEEKRKKSPEYVALMERLRAEVAEREYRALLADRRGGSTKIPVETIDAVGKYAFLSEKSSHENHDTGSVAKTVKQQLAAVVNVAVTVAAVSFAVWRWSERLSGGKDDIGTRALLSIAAGLLVLVADTVIFGGYLRRVDDARERERALPERKAVVDTVVIGGKSSRRKEKTL